MEAVRSEGDLKDYYIPDYVLVPGLEVEDVPVVPCCPVIVFINSKSGGQLGGELLVTFRALLNPSQVIDLGEKAPDKVLHQVYTNLQTLKNKGHQFADEVEDRLRIVVAGGDGTAGWLLSVISDLKLLIPPPVAMVPLGTGNNVHFSFGWGKKNPGTDRASVEPFLERVKTAKEMKIDSWHIIMRMKSPVEGSCEPVAAPPSIELPHSLHAFQRVSRSDALNVEGYHTFRGGFWNYFSMGMDAQVSYSFHSERKLHPEQFKNQMMNQSTYLKLAYRQGCFFPSLSNAPSNIAELAKVKVMKKHGHWEDLFVPPKIRSIVCLNLPSFSGGLNPWGNPTGKKAIARDLTPPYVDDALLEVVGFRNGWHGLTLLASNGHGTRLAQASRIRFEFHKGAADHTFMRIDGEPWKQPLPVNDDTVTIEISSHGQVTMLANPPCQSKSIQDPTVPISSHGEGADSSEEDNSEEDSEERRKFGAANTFRLPDEFD